MKKTILLSVLFLISCDFKDKNGNSPLIEDANGNLIDNPAYTEENSSENNYVDTSSISTPTKYPKFKVPGKDYELTDKEKKEIADYKKETAIRESKERKQFGIDFRNKMLDRNMDVKVLVFGKENKKIRLTYVLFNDVWYRKFETLGYFEQIHQRGFTHIELTDGFGYGKGIKYE